MWAARLEYLRNPYIRLSSDKDRSHLDSTPLSVEQASCATVKIPFLDQINGLLFPPETKRLKTRFNLLDSDQGSPQSSQYEPQCGA
ncbi:hypothetical protein PoB_005367200 [Plakobranchus ocellatus]|uniref:Uncharacterized protein n=1 Tax=Plakobranchus ocellatus TaxID=259542 RepID=A0AAV4C7B6_9GAST|nr:hypothetical protein PoB_005367200 [Plakobranchus ocellatus]